MFDNLKLNLNYYATILKCSIPTFSCNKITDIDGNKKLFVGVNSSVDKILTFYEHEKNHFDEVNEYIDFAYLNGKEDNIYSSLNILDKDIIKFQASIEVDDDFVVTNLRKIVFENDAEAIKALSPYFDKLLKAYPNSYVLSAVKRKFGYASEQKECEADPSDFDFEAEFAKHFEESQPIDVDFEEVKEDSSKKTATEEETKSSKKKTNEEKAKKTEEKEETKTKSSKKKTTKEKEETKTATKEEPVKTERKNPNEMVFTKEEKDDNCTFAYIDSLRKFLKENFNLHYKDVKTLLNDKVLRFTSKNVSNTIKITGKTVIMFIAEDEKEIVSKKYIFRKER